MPPSPPRRSPHHRRGDAGFRRLVIVGAGGFGREVRWWARDSWEGIEIAGFLDADPARGSAGEPVLGDPAAWEPREDDGYVLAIGIPGVRRRVAEGMLSRGARLVALCHPTAVIAPTATIAPGAVVCPHAVVSDSAAVGRCAIVNYHASVAHDAAVGDYAVLSPYATLAGGARVGEDAFLGLHASIGPGCTLGDRSKVSANSCLLADAPPDSIVYGVPGRIAPRLA